MRNIEKIVRALLAPATIAGILVAFMTLTFLAARLLTDLLGHPSLVIFLMAWVITTLAGVMLVRQLPRVLDR
jgi:Flp pilus assembly protein TadB